MFSEGKGRVTGERVRTLAVGIVEEGAYFSYSSISMLQVLNREDFGWKARFQTSIAY
jgi:hypothetical protein